MSLTEKFVIYMSSLIYLDMVQLRKSDFFNNKKYETSYTERPIMKYKSGHNFIEVDDLEHEVLLELYHASLKQFESLPRCVFYIEFWNMALITTIRRKISIFKLST